MNIDLFETGLLYMNGLCNSIVWYIHLDGIRLKHFSIAVYNLSEPV